MRHFVDTSAIIAVMDSAADEHATARAVWDAIVTPAYELVTSNYVVLELHAVAQRRFGMRGVRLLCDAFLPALEVHWVAADLHQAAVTAMLAANRRELSLVDCVSFAVMRELGINAAFTLDRHFAEQGFEVTPAQGQ